MHVRPTLSLDHESRTYPIELVTSHQTVTPKTPTINFLDQLLDTVFLPVRSFPVRAPFIKKGLVTQHPLRTPFSEGGYPPIPPPTCGGSDVIHRPYIGPTVAFGLSNHTTTMSSQPEPRRRSLRIIEARRKILRDTIREIVQEYKRAQRRQRWRDAIWDIVQQKRAKKDHLKRMVRKMAEQRRAQKAAELRARIRERQEDRRCVVCLYYHAPSDLHMQRLFHIHGLPEKLNFPRKVLNTTIRMWCCQACVHMACVLQSMHSQYGRANKHLWRMHVQYLLSETTRIHDLSTRKMHLIRGNRRTAVLTNRTICTIRESLLRPVSIRVLRVIVAVCRLFLSTRKRHLIK